MVLLRPRGGDGERDLARLRLRLRMQPDGLELWLPMVDKDSPFLAFKKFVPAFTLWPAGTAFSRTHDLSALRKHKNPVFRANKKGEVQLASGAVPVPPGAIAHLELPALSSSTWRKPLDLNLHLPPRRLPRVYYLLCRRGLLPSLIDSDGQVEFAREPVDESDGGNDPVGVGIARRNPQRQVLRFRSLTALPVLARPALSLQEGGHMLRRSLPPPDPRDHCLLTLPGEAPREFLYHLLET